MKTRKNYIGYLAVVAVLMALFSPARSYADDSTTAPCVLGYTVGFFNGVWNTEAEAMVSLNALKQSVEEATGKSDDTYNNEDVGYQLFYNHTGSTAGGTKLQDIAEVFEQRQQELDPSGTFSSNLYLVWEDLTANMQFTTTLSGAKEDLKTFFKNFAVKFAQGAVAALSDQLSNPPTSEDYAAQNAELDALASAGRKMVLIAHSQGNLFINQGYDHIQPVVGSTRVKAVHIAPASPTLRGQYILSSDDVIINGLRLDGGVSSVPANNITIAYSDADPSGHTLVGSYLDVNSLRSNGRQQVEALEVGAFSALTAPSNCAVKVSPSSSTLQPGGSVALTAALNPPPTDPILNVEYQWSVSGNAGGGFTTPTGPVTSLDTSSSTVTYAVPSTANSQTTDTITVKALGAKTAGDYVNVVDLGSGTATATVSTLYVQIAPASVNVAQGGQTTFTASVPGTSTTGYTYMWTTTGKYGTLTEVGGQGRTGQTSYCSTSSQATYVSNSSVSLPGGSASEKVSVQAFTPGSGGASPCDLANALNTADATVNLNGSVTQWLGAWNCPGRPGYSPYIATFYSKPFPSGDFNPPDSGRSNLMEIDGAGGLSGSYRYLIAVGNTAQDEDYDGDVVTYRVIFSNGSLDILDDGVTVNQICTR